MLTDQLGFRRDKSQDQVRNISKHTNIVKSESLKNIISKNGIILIKRDKHSVDWSNPDTHQKPFLFSQISMTFF